jgi:tetratricopeptide (TPR) repeat protein
MSVILNYLTKMFSLKETDHSSSSSFIYYLAISFFWLALLALLGFFADVSFLVSFAFSGLFFTLYDFRAKKSGILLFFGIFFAITIPQLLQINFVVSFIGYLREGIVDNTNGVIQISSVSIGNAITIASLGLVLLSLWSKNKQLKDIKIENNELKEAMNQHEEWANKFAQINQVEDPGEQLEQLADLIANEKDHTFIAQCYNFRGDIYKEQNHGHKALLEYTRAIDFNPSEAGYYRNRGLIHRKLKNYQEAFEDYSKAITLNSKYAVAYNNRGNLLREMGRGSEALMDFNKAIELDPNNAFTYNNRGILLRDIGQQSGAKADYDKAIEINPDYTKAYFNRGILLRDMGKGSEALMDYNKAIEINPDYANAYNNRGNLLREMGKGNEALMDYNKAIELNPEHANAYNNRGNQLRDMGKGNEALMDYIKAIELNPENANAYWNRGKLLLGLGEESNALSDYLKASELDSTLKNLLEPIISGLRLNLEEAATAKE